MNFDKLAGGITQSGDPGVFLKQELEEGLEPITKRVDALEKKLDLLFISKILFQLLTKYYTKESTWKLIISEH
jgi:hypothetical protein